MRSPEAAALGWAALGLVALAGWARPQMPSEGESVPELARQPRPEADLHWVRTGGPLGGIGYDVRVDPVNPRTLFVTDAFSGVSRSADGGETWTPCNQGITSRTGPSGDAIPVFCLTIDARNPRVLWAGTQGMKGVFKSTDGGAAWVKSDHGIPDLEGITFRSFTIDPQDSDVVYAGTEIPTRRRGPDGQNEVGGKVFKTTDGGNTWTEILDTGALVRWMAIDPTDTRILYAATGIFDRDEVRPEGILKSTDGGKTWRNLNVGLPNLTVGGLVMHPRNPKTLYCATGRHNGFGGGPQAAWGGVYRTTDGGETWAEVLRRPHEYFPVTSIALAPGNPELVYVAPSGSTFYRSQDGGRTWRSFPMQPEGASVGIPIALTVDPREPTTIYLNSYIGGVFKSTDGGQSWRVASQGYTGAQLTDAGVDPDYPAVVYAIGRQGVAKSLNGGARWVYLNRGKAEQFIEGAALSVNPRNPLDLLISSRFEGDIRRSTDGGLTWRSVFRTALRTHYPDNLHGVVGFARFAGNPQIVYAAGRMATETMGANPMARSLGVSKSTDGGESWRACNTGLIADLNINTVAVHPAAAEIAYAGALNGGVYQTTDGGENWHSCGLSLPRDIRALAVNPSNPRLIYAGTQNSGLFLSTDGGQNWRTAAGGIEPNAAIHAIVVDPAQANAVWAADYHSGVYRSLDGGRRWTPVNRGLTTRAVNALAISRRGDVLYAATEGEGVFRLGEAPVSSK